MNSILRPFIIGVNLKDITVFLNNKQEAKDPEFSAYKNILVVWDEDRDPRVLDLIDEMKKKDRSNLLLIHEHEGSVRFLWKDKFPVKYRTNSRVDIRSGDSWIILSSESLSGDDEFEEDFPEEDNQ